jgi:hypothetical protein
MLARPLLAAALVATGSAVGLSRLVPQPRTSRTPAPARHVLVGPLGFEPNAAVSVWLDAETGRTTEAAPLDGQTLRHASVSPWLDESGRPQAIGRAVRRPDDPAPDLLALVRMTFPEGRVLDRIAVDVLPASPPCWWPDTGARVLFGGGDGRLYRFDFEPPDGTAGADEQPRPLAWGCPPPGRTVHLGSPCWPDDARFARTILVVISTYSADTPRRPMSTARIWWLRLDDAGEAIVDAGPVFDPDAIPSDREVAGPSVGTTPGGGLVLAYYLSADRKAWDLHLAELTVDDAGRPRVASGAGRRLAGECRPFIPAAFSGDGRWISAVQFDRDGRGMILRLDLAADETPDPPPGSARRADGVKWTPLATLVRTLLEACLELGAVEASP